MQLRTLSVCLVLLCFGRYDGLIAQQVHGLDAIRLTNAHGQPLFVTAPPGDSSRLFFVDRLGFVGIIDLTTGAVDFNQPAFLNISNEVTTNGGEQGLLGMAFDPDYASNGKFYVNYTVPGGAFGAGVTHIAQFTVSSDPRFADATSEKTVLMFDQPQTNHNGGWIGFSPRAGDDHNLYIATGDGGAANDQGTGHIEPSGNAQNNTTLLGKMLRIHVDPTTGTYTIPSNNPFFGSTTLKQEIWLLGLRNPFRDSFDRANGRMFIGDVGQDTREEIDAQQPTNPGGGENYGWRLREGTIATPTGSPVVGGPPPPGNVDPIVDYPRTTGGTVIGGYIYRGAQFPQLRGVYVFGDYLASKVFTLNYDGATASNLQDITSQLFPIPTTSGNVSLGNPSSFGEDAAGELYITDIANGNIYKLSPMVVGAASRKTHGTTPFDVDLPLTGSPGIECRSGGTNGDYTMVFRFALPLSSVGGRTVTAGVGSVSSSMIDSSDPREYIVNLTGVTNAQYVAVTLTNAVDVVGNISSSVSATMGVLTGDTTGNGLVNSSDIAQTQSQSGQPLTMSNFREDVTLNGAINSSDISAVQAQSGTGLPAPPAPSTASSDPRRAKLRAKSRASERN